MRHLVSKRIEKRPKNPRETKVRLTCQATGCIFLEWCLCKMLQPLKSNRAQGRPRAGAILWFKSSKQEYRSCVTPWLFFSSRLEPCEQTRSDPIKLHQTAKNLIEKNKRMADERARYAQHEQNDRTLHSRRISFTARTTMLGEAVFCIQYTKFTMWMKDSL